MSRLGTYKTRTLSALLAAGTIVTCHTDASDRAVSEVREASEVMWFRSGAVLFEFGPVEFYAVPRSVGGQGPAFFDCQRLSNECFEPEPVGFKV